YVTLTRSPPSSTLVPYTTLFRSLAWGNEPDTWRYAAPRRWWPVLPYAVALAVGPVLCVAGGWMMAELSGEGPNDVGPALRSMVRSEEHTSELQSRGQLVCRLLLE